MVEQSKSEVASEDTARVAASLRHCGIYTDGHAGNLRQAQALARALGVSASLYKVSLRGLDRAFAPQFRRARWQNLTIKPQHTPPALAIGCGRAGAVALDALKRAYPSSRTVQILDPRCTLERFDLVICPEHDRLAGANVLSCLGALHGVDEQSVAEARTAWTQLGADPSPRTLLLLGAPTRHMHYTPADLRHLLMQLTGPLWISASRRTPAELRAVAQARTDARYWGPDMEAPNPYAGMLSWAQRIVVTPDSVNMVSEACATHAAVHLPWRQRARGKLAQFVASVLPRLSELQDFSTHVPLRETARVAAQLVARLAC